MDRCWRWSFEIAKLTKLVLNPHFNENKKWNLLPLEVKCFPSTRRKKKGLITLKFFFLSLWTHPFSQGIASASMIPQRQSSTYPRFAGHLLFISHSPHCFKQVKDQWNSSFYLRKRMQNLAENGCFWPCLVERIFAVDWLNNRMLTIIISYDFKEKWVTHYCVWECTSWTAYGRHWEALFYHIYVSLCQQWFLY